MFLPKLMLSFPHFQNAELCGLQMGTPKGMLRESEKGAICHALSEGIPKQNTKPLACEKHPRLLNKSYGQASGVTSWDSPSAVSTRSVTTSLTFPGTERQDGVCPAKKADH